MLLRKLQSNKSSKTQSDFYSRLEQIRSSVQKNVFLSSRISEVNNCGSIIVFTSIENRKKLEEIVNFVEEQIYERNELYNIAGQTDFSILRLSHVRLFVISISGQNEPTLTESFRANCRSYCVSRRGLVKASVHFGTNNTSVMKIMHEILCSDYEISSTTVNGIPMKEESDPNNSRSYDVELFHHNRIHNFFQIHNLLQSDSPIATKIDSQYITAKLRWSGVNSKFNINDVSRDNLT